MRSARNRKSRMHNRHALCPVSCTSHLEASTSDAGAHRPVYCWRGWATQVHFTPKPQMPPNHY